jgi:hypothetical protein
MNELMGKCGDFSVHIYILYDFEVKSLTDDAMEDRLLENCEGREIIKKC